jgi:dolichol-phosphate mannosyltransferase
MKLSSLSVVLLAYNEEDLIASTVESAERYASQSAEEHEIVVVGFAGCTDRTNAIVRELAQGNPRLRLVLQERHERGYGRALHLGIQNARCDWILQSDADGQYDFAELSKLLPHTAEPMVALIHGYRAPRRDPRERLVMAAAYNLALRALYRIPLRDVDSAFKLMRGSVVRALPIHSLSGFGIAELVLRLLKAHHRVVQVPVRHLPRAGGAALADKGTTNPFGLELPNLKLVQGTLGEMFRMRAELRPGR